jgi:ABC-type multidrug transport system fused ATPase/permease subunit
MSAAPISVGADALTLTWVVVGSLILELLILIVFLVRVAWWLSQRFTLIDATLAANAKEITAIKEDVSNDIAGRRVVAEARTDIAQIKATMGEFRERIDRIEANEDGRKHA